MKQERILYLDITKFVAICLVCIGHAYYLTIGTESNVRSIIYLFHMPLFMIISGFFSINSFKLPFIPFIKAKQLLLPFITFYVILSLYHIIICHFVIDINMLIEIAIALLWFLKTLFICYLIVYLFKRLKNIPDIYLAITTSLLFIIIPKGYIMSINSLLPMFWTGYFCRKYIIEGGSFKWWITPLSSVIFGFCTLFYFKNPTLYMPFTYKLLINYPLLIAYEYLIGLTGSFTIIGIVMFFSKKYGNNYILTKLGDIGKYTLGIFVMQFFLIEQIGRMFFKITPISRADFPLYDYIVSPLIGIVGLLISYSFVLILSKIKIVNLLFFGGQYS